MMRDRVSSGSPYEMQIGFSRALKAGPRIVVSGTAPMAPDGTSYAPGDPGSQTQRCLEIIVESVRALGGRQEDIVRTRMYLTNAADWEAVAHIHGQFFGRIRPAATCVVVSGLLRPEWRVEIEAEAEISEDLRIDAYSPFDRDWLERRCQMLFHGTTVVSWGVAHEPLNLPGLVARRAGERLGFVSFNIEEKSCEVVALEALTPRGGLGSTLLRALETSAARSGCDYFWTIVTNDNLDALRFFQRHGYTLQAINVGALEASRKLKPSIPALGYYGIPLRDELILEKILTPTP